MKKSFSFATIMKWVIGSISTLTLAGGVILVMMTMTYIHHLQSELIAERSNYQGQITYLQAIGADNAKFANWFNHAFSKTRVTSYVPYLGGINGGGKVYANGEPVLPLAASRAALKSGSVRMGDFVLLVGQIKDTKGPSILGHSFDIHVPDMAAARMFGSSNFKWANLSRAPKVN